MKLRAMIPLALATALLAVPALAAQTSGPNAQVQAVVDEAMTAGMAGDMSKMREQYAPDCVFADEFAPFFWSGSGSLEAYLTSGGRMYEETQHIPGKTTLSPPTYVYVSGDRAFVIEPVSGEGTVRGKPYAQQGAFAFSLSRTDGRWKITSQTWTKTGESLNPY